MVRLALLATVYYALKAILDPTIPANGGFYRAIEVEAPEGCIVNARPPAPVGWRTQTCQRIADVIFGALAPALPDRVPAAGNGANSAWVFSGLHPRTGRYYVYLETLAGGAGATARADGLDAVQVHITNTSNLPVECLEMEYPLLVEEYALADESGGTGRFRGGLGLRRTIEVLGHDAQFLGTLERAEIPPGASPAADPAAARPSCSTPARRPSGRSRRRSGDTRSRPGSRPDRHPRRRGLRASVRLARAISGGGRGAREAA